MILGLVVASGLLTGASPYVAPADSAKAHTTFPLSLGLSLASGPSIRIMPADRAVFATAFAPAVSIAGIDAVPAAFTATFNAATLIRGATSKVLTAAPAAFAWTPQSARLLRGRRLPAAPMACVTTFQAATLAHGTAHRLTAAPAVFTATFKDATLRRPNRLSAAPATFATAFNPAALAANARTETYLLDAAGNFLTDDAGNLLALAVSSAPLPAPSLLRRFAVPAESRRLSIAAESRSLAIPAEHRGQRPVVAAQSYAVAGYFPEGYVA